MYLGHLAKPTVQGKPGKPGSGDGADYRLNIAWLRRCSARITGVNYLPDMEGAGGGKGRIPRLTILYFSYDIIG